MNGDVTSYFVYTADDERIGVLHKGAGGYPEQWSLRGLNGKVLRQYAKGSGETIFEDGFEDGNTTCWSLTDPPSGGGTCSTSLPLLPLRRFVYRDGQLLPSVEASGEVFHYHPDHLGSPRLVTNGAGIGDANTYFPFGEELVLEDAEGFPAPGFSFSLPLKFTEHERDLGIALAGNFEQDDVDYMHARYYWPIFGRFLSPDPIVASSFRGPQSWNRYSYVYGNPVNYVDRFGLLGSSYREEITVTDSPIEAPTFGLGALLETLNRLLNPSLGAFPEIGLSSTQLRQGRPADEDPCGEAQQLSGLRAFLAAVNPRPAVQIRGSFGEGDVGGTFNLQVNPHYATFRFGAGLTVNAPVPGNITGAIGLAIGRSQGAGFGASAALGQQPAGLTGLFSGSTTMGGESFFAGIGAGAGGFSGSLQPVKSFRIPLPQFIPFPEFERPCQ